MSCIKSDEIKYTKPPIEKYLNEYNDLLAEILVANMHSFKYLASASLNRLEAVTHLYEKINKYIQIKILLKSQKDSTVKLVGEDTSLFKILKKDFGGRVEIATESEEGSSNFVKNSPVYQLVLFFVRGLIHFFISISFSLIALFKIRIGTGYDSIMRTYFDFRSVTNDGRLKEEYYGDFVFDLARTEKILVVYKLLHYTPKEIKKYLKLRTNSDFDSCILEYFINPFKIIGIFARYYFSRIVLKEKYYFDGHDITGIIQKSLNDDYLSYRNLNVFFEYEAAKKMLTLNPERLYYPYENQTWEKIYPFVKHQEGYSKIKIIGFQHTGLSFKLMNYFPSILEKKLPIFPDKIITVGNILCRFLKEKSNFPCEIVEGAALRVTKFIKDNQFQFKIPDYNINKKIVYAFSYDLVKYRQIINILLEVFQNCSIQVYFKIHPDYEENSVIKNLGIKLSNNFILAQKISWDAVYSSVDCILYDDNSIGLEGMINGLKTFLLDEGDPIYDCNRMFYFDSWKTVLKKDDLFMLKEEIESGKFEKKTDMNVVRKYIGDYYNIYSKEKYFSVYF